MPQHYNDPPDGDDPRTTARLGAEVIASMMARPDATRVADPTQHNPEMGAAENTFRNILSGVDPSMGVFTHMMGLEPERPAVGTQLLAGLVGPGIPKGGAALAMRNWKSIQRQLDDIIRVSYETGSTPGGLMKLLATKQYNTFDEAIQVAPLEQVDEIANQMTEIYRAGDKLGDEGTKRAAQLLRERADAEILGRHISGDASAKSLVGEVWDPMVAIDPGMAGDILNEKLGEINALRATLDASLGGTP